MKPLHFSFLNKQRFILVAFLFALASGVTFAGFEEGDVAYKRKDYATSLKEFLPLAEQGNAVAQYKLGVMYENGRGVDVDYQEAVRWYELAAAQGHMHAQTNLGFIYGTGRGVKQNYQEALRLYRLAATQKDDVAQYSLGMM